MDIVIFIYMYIYNQKFKSLLVKYKNNNLSNNIDHKNLDKMHFALYLFQTT